MKAGGKALGVLASGLGGAAFGPFFDKTATESGRAARKLLTNHDGPIFFAKVVLQNPLDLEIGQAETFQVDCENMTCGSKYSVYFKISRI